MPGRQTVDDHPDIYSAPAIQTFYHWRDEHCVVGVRAQSSAHNEAPAYFLPPCELSTFFTVERVKQVLVALWQTRSHLIPVDANAIQEKYLTGFAILLSIGHGRYIETFVKHRTLGDRYLPFDAKPSDFPSAADCDLFAIFKDAQWKFCAPRLTYQRLTHFKQEEILPIVAREKIGEGGSAVTWKIQLHPDYNHLNRRSRLENDLLKDTFVIKTFHTFADSDESENELEAFVKVRDNAPDAQGLTKFYGSYRHGSSFNILLEYCNGGTLEDYFKTIPRPSRSREIANFWDSLLKLVLGVCSISDIKVTDADGEQTLQGFHQDIKPRNILLSKPAQGDVYRCDFKLADLGLSHFSTKLFDNDSQGSRTYGAPECYRFDDLNARSPRKISPKADVFSLACILSEAAEWTIRHYPGVLEYRQRRRQEHSIIPDFQDPGCFHDGQDVLESVLETHKEIKEDKACSDIVTGRLVDLINEMLLRAKERPDAHNVRYKSQKILHSAQSKLVRSPDRQSTLSRAESDLTNEGSFHSPKRSPVIGNHSKALVHADLQSLPSRAVTFDEMAHPSQSHSAFTQRLVYPEAQSQHATYESVSEGFALGQQESFKPFSRQSTLQQQNWIQNDIFSEPQRFSNQHLATSEGIPNGQHMAPTLRPNPSISRPSTTPTHLHGTPEMSDNSIPRQLPKDEPIRRNASDPRIDSVPSAAGEPEVHREVAAPSDRPILSLENAIRWRNKEVGAMRYPRSHEDEWCLREINKRDQIFLLDNSKSMNKHWEQLIQVLDLLVFMTQDADPDGVECILTNPMSGSDTIKAKKPKAPVELSNFARRSQPGGSRIVTNMYTSLNYILQRQRSKIENDANAGAATKFIKRKAGKRLRPLSLTILTDGNWQGRDDPATSIRSTMDTLIAKGRDPHEIGIQFIQFGNEPNGTEYLKFLDENLRRSHNGNSWDIVDTEMWNGNVWKMLLGHINPWWDED
ncbi:MAG: hypothetical protein M1820_003048 [Bogoriella megaspora]|nr:MAG: hypothetical protein M1820_003048 [Bogoriella megaspora]